MRKSEKKIKINSKNEKMKRLFKRYCEGPKGSSEKTIGFYLNAICLYEKFTEYECFSKFNDDQAVKFRESLINCENKKALSTVYDYLRYLKIFFTWLSTQTGFKKAIKNEHVEYLRLSRQQTEMALTPQRERYPSLEIVQKVVHSMPANTVLELRDRAIISFTLLSGMRDKAIITLPLKCFDPQSYEVYHDVKSGVKSKFSKTHQTYLFQFDEKMINYILDWYNYLIKDELYTPSDPFFPRNKVEQSEFSKSFVSNSIEPKFWQTTSSITEIFKQRFEQAGMEYYSPHTFRHLANNLTKKACSSMEEFQAVSQNFGHQNIGTTFSSYGRLPANQVKEAIQSLDFSGKKKKINVTMSKLEKLLEIIED